MSDIRVGDLEDPVDAGLADVVDDVLDNIVLDGPVADEAAAGALEFLNEKDTMRDSTVRTVVPATVGAVAALIVSAAASRGLSVPMEPLVLILSVVFTAIYYRAVRFLETQKNSKWGKLLGVAKAPVYPIG